MRHRHRHRTRRVGSKLKELLIPILRAKGDLTLLGDRVVVEQEKLSEKIRARLGILNHGVEGRVESIYLKEGSEELYCCIKTSDQNFFEAPYDSLERTRQTSKNRSYEKMLRAEYCVDEKNL